jgi:penicillin amidase
MSDTKRRIRALLALVVFVMPLAIAKGTQVDPTLDLYASPQHLVRLDNGRQMNMLCQGSGRPVVILEAGAGGSTLEWRSVQRKIAQTTRVCAYDRAGMGFSDPGPLPRTADAVVSDFVALLHAAAIEPPYVMVAHSLGSYYARLYADHHPREVAGMVLVDPSVEYQDKRFGEISPAYQDLLRKENETARECLRMARAGTLTADLPIFKECTYGYSRDPSFSEALFQVQIKRRLSPDFRETLLSETEEMNGADSEELVSARRSYGNMPLIVLTHGAQSVEAYPGLTVEQVDAMDRLWTRMHEELTALSLRGSHRRVERSGHYIQKDRPDVVIDAVQEVVRDIRDTRAAATSKRVTMTVQGLAHPAKIFVDQWGIAHIFAESIHDAFFLQGYNAARDRLWQIDLWRKRGLGLLAKSFGAAYVEQDRASRLFLYRGDMTREWSSYAPGAQDTAAAFVAGINAYVEEVRKGRKPLPPEFKITGSMPDSWQAEDVVRIRSHGLADNLFSEVTRAQVACQAGLSADRLRVKLEPPHLTTVPAGLDPCKIPADVLKDYELATEAVRFTPKDIGQAANINVSSVSEGSNNWVIAPSHSETGRPVLANDPHRRLEIPSLRYIVQLDAPGLSVIGAGEPAVPGVSFGHNGHVAFGLTIFEVDQEDLYAYSLKPGDPDRYRYGQGWEALHVVHETIEVKGEPARQVELRFTRHGPVVALDRGADLAFAVRSVWSEPGTSPYFASTWLPQVKTWKQFLAARDRWGTPPLNLIYADVSGNIGWAAGAMVPVRPNWDGLLPVPGDGRYEWQGFLSGARLPSTYNPPKGWFATANEMNLPAAYPAERRSISFEWANRARIDRIDSVLGAKAKLGMADSMGLQNDTHNAMAGSLIAMLGSLSSPDPLVSKSIDVLKAWDGDETVASIAATLYEVWTTQYLGPMTVERVTPANARGLVGRGSLDAIVDYLNHPDTHLGPDPGAARSDLLLSSLDETVAYLTRQLGSDMSTWRWGRLHQIAFEPAAAALADSRLRARMSLPALELPGSANSPRAASFSDTDFSVVAGASVRMVLDVGQWDNSVVINAPGQSDDPDSGHYRDLLPLWASGRYVPLLFSRSAVEQAAEEIIDLTPAGDRGILH